MVDYNNNPDKQEEQDRQNRQKKKAEKKKRKDKNLADYDDEFVPADDSESSAPN